MAKKGTYQRKKERKNKFLTIFGVLLLVSVLLMSIIELVRHGVILQVLESGDIQEYRSNYTLRVKERRRHDSYIFTWEDGSYTSVLSREIQYKLHAFIEDSAGQEEMVVQYIRLPPPFRDDEEKLAISLSSATDGTVYYTQTKGDFLADMAVLVVVALLMLLCLSPFGVLYLYLPLQEQRIRKKKEKRREERKQKQQKPKPEVNHDQYRTD